LSKIGVLAAAAAVLALGAAPAGATTVSSENGVLTISDTQGTNDLVYLRPPDYPATPTDQVVVDSAADTLNGGPGCTEAPPQQALYVREFHCTRGEHLTLDVHLGGGDDMFFDYGRVPYDSAVIDGGPGGDQLETTSGGPDRFIGGDGNDMVGYAYTLEGVTATIDGQPNDGVPGEGDNIGTDVEGLNGGFGDDHLYGTDGNDRIYAGSGDDVVVGGAGNDTLSGDQGKDQIDGGPGQDSLDGAEWPHYQSSDTLDCGDGFDYARVDEYDMQTGCENGSYPMGGGASWSSQPPLGTGYPAWLPPMPGPTLSSAGTLDPKKAVARVQAHCADSASAACRGELTLKPAGKHPTNRRIASGHFSIAPGKAKKVGVKLTAYGRRTVKGRHKLRVRAVAASDGGAVVRKTLMLRVVGKR
jgi:hypothetical protein